MFKLTLLDLVNLLINPMATILSKRESPTPSAVAPEEQPNLPTFFNQNYYCFDGGLVIVCCFLLV
jgi:hypothetical protein